MKRKDLPLTNALPVAPSSDCLPPEDPKPYLPEQYVVGLRLYGVKLEFRSNPIPNERHAADLVTQMQKNLGYDACLYRIEGTEERRLSESELEAILKSESILAGVRSAIFFKSDK